MGRVLVIQTAFIGDAILGTALLEKLHRDDPDARIDYLVRDGHQSLFTGHPFLHRVLTWKKRSGKYTALWNLLKEVRAGRYDAVYNLQRYAASGLLTAFSGARHRVGYGNNPLAFLFSRSVPHRFGKGFEKVHEVDRVLDLVGSESRVSPRLYPTRQDVRSVQGLMTDPYITIAPASVWFTKQLPVGKWIEFIDRIPAPFTVHLIGAQTDRAVTQQIVQGTSRPVSDLSGQLELLQTAALMQRARMNYANDSAPVHLASAVDAPVTEVYCSTVPAFGFTPLSSVAHVVEPARPLDCRPCGIHGHSQCPLSHFACAQEVDVRQLTDTLPVL